VARSATTATTVASQRSHAIASIVDSLGIAPEDWSTHAISVQEEWEWRENTNTKVGYRASVGATVRVRDLGQVATLVQRSVDEAHATISSLEWALSVEHPARRQVLAASAADGMARALAYAGALGLTVGRIEEVSDVPLPLAPAPRSPGAELRVTKMADASTGVAANPGAVQIASTVYIRVAAS
jgi:uncharacterized protein YggE